MKYLKLIKTFFTFCFICLLTSVSVSAQVVPDPYKPIIEKYISGISNINTYDYNLLGDFGGGQWPYGREHLGEYGYCIADIDGNGTPELLTKGIKYPLTIAAIFTIENNSAKQLINFRGSDGYLDVTANVPRHPELSNCILNCQEDTYHFLKLSGTQLVPVITAGYNDVRYLLPGNSQNFEYTPFIAYDPNAKPVVRAPEGSLYRLYNRFSGEHFYTPGFEEADYLTRYQGWTSEDIGWVAPQNEGDPVYRLYNPGLNDHLYTTSEAEVSELTSKHGWQADNGGRPLFYSGGDVPIYRLYNSRSGRHLLTKSLDEYNTLPAHGWEQEGEKLRCLS